MVGVIDENRELIKEHRFRLVEGDAMTPSIGEALPWIPLESQVEHIYSVRTL